MEQCVLDQDVNDGKTLNKDIAKDFKANNSSERAEGTVMKATSLSKVDARKQVGSMAVRPKHRFNADYLLRTSMAMLDATDAFCSSSSLGTAAVHATTATVTNTMAFSLSRNTFWLSAICL